MDILILCLVGLAQHTMASLPVVEVTEYQKVWVAIQQKLWEIDSGTDYYSRLTGQHIQVASMCWMPPVVLTKEHIVEAIMIEHYMALLPFKPPNLVLCHQPATLEDAVSLMEA